MCKKLGHGRNYIGQPRTLANTQKFLSNTRKLFARLMTKRSPASLHGMSRSSGGSNTLHRSQTYSAVAGSSSADRRTQPRTAMPLLTKLHHAPSDEINQGILKLWRANRVQLLMQVHDNILFQFPEELEDEIIPWATETLKILLNAKKRTEFHVPTDAKTGWNWGNFSEDNPDGLKKWRGGDTRQRKKRSSN
jgi:hypothetical protein